MLVARLVQVVRRHDQNNDVAEKAMDYLRRSDLAGSVLREIKTRHGIPDERDIDAELIAAVNLLCKYAELHLRNGWTISLHFTEDIWSMEVADDDGDDVFVESANGCSDFRLACDLSREVPE